MSLIEFIIWFFKWFDQWLRSILNLIRLLARQQLAPLARYLPDFGDALEELASRASALRRLGVKSFVAAGPEEGFELGSIATFLGGFAAMVTVLVAVGYVLSTIAPRLLSAIICFRNEGNYQANLTQIQRDIFARGAASQGTPADLGRSWRPPAEQQFYARTLLELNSAPATAAGPASTDDLGFDDLKNVVVGGHTELPNQSPIQSTSSTRTGPSLETPGGPDYLRDAAQQRERLRVLQNGDLTGYNTLLPQHGQQIQSSGRDPGTSGFYPGQPGSKPKK